MDAWAAREAILRRWRTLENPLTATAGVILACNWVALFWLSAAMPREPDPAHGFTVPFGVQGHIVYLTPLLDLLHRTAFWVGLALFFGAALIDFYKDPYLRQLKSYVTR